MSDHNTTMIPCPECKRKGDDHLVEVFVSDSTLKAHKVEAAEDLTDEDLYTLYDKDEAEIDAVCSDCGSDYRRNENGSIIS